MSVVSRLAGAAALALVTLFCLTTSAQTFTQHTAAVSSAGWIAKADFNRDTVPDLVVGEANGNIAVVIMNGDGTIRSTMTYSTGSYNNFLQGVVAADFNRDGNMDIAAITDVDGSAIAVFLGNGTGAFPSAPARFVTRVYQPKSIDLGDFDGDGKLDLMVADVITSGGGPDTENIIWIFPGDGAGSFDVDNPIELDYVGTWNNEFFPTMRKAVTGDFNGDGKADIAFIQSFAQNADNVSRGGEVYVLRNDGGGQFSHYKVAATSQLTDLAAADVSQDGASDLIATYADPNASCSAACKGVLYFKSNRDGTFVGQSVGNFSDAAFYVNPHGPSAADVNDDGLKDIIVSSAINDYHAGTKYNAAVLMLQSPDGTFTGSNQKLYKIAASGGGSTLGEDIKRDGRVDIAVAGGSALSVLVNTTSLRGCPAPSAIRKLKICEPINSTITSPVQVMANTTDNEQVTAMKIYIDAVSKFVTSDDFLSTRLALPAGDHKMTVKAWDRLGPYSQSINFTVSTGCVSPGTERTVMICLPLNGASVPSPVYIEGTINDSGIVQAVKIYVDGVTQYSFNGTTKYVQTSIPMSRGSHRLTVKVWDQLGAFSSSVNVSVQ